MRQRLAPPFVFIFFFAYTCLQAQTTGSCDSLASKGIGRTLADSALYYGMQAACAERFLTLFNPSFVRADDCCALKYFSDKGVFCMFVDEDSKEGNMLFDTRYRLGYNYIMQQRIRQKLGENFDRIPDEVYHSREQLDDALIKKITKSLRIKTVMPGRVKVTLKGKKFSNYDSVPVTCLPEALNGLRLKDLRRGIEIPSRNDAEKHVELLLLTLDFSALVNNPHVCVCSGRHTYSIRLAAKAKKKK